ncbi:MAG TPA: prepilin-type N-terminal cleavage/methylation domain-containing protein [Nitrospirota bacterium]|nr:prepilin-type N-terminal cleavage/methylation domain-containing protein [Nitrospirota bacterium]
MIVNRLHSVGKQSGFTLIELLIAISILALGLLAVATMQSIALNSNSVSNKVSVASYLAQQVAEEICARDIDDPLLNTNSSGSYQFTDWTSGTQQIVSSVSVTGAGTFSASYNIQANTYYGTPFTGMTQIRVTVKNATYTTHKMVL